MRKTSIIKISKNIIYSIFTFLAILIYFKIIFKETSYNILLSLLFVFLYYFYFKNDKKYNKRDKKYSFIISILISAILSIGSIVSSYIFEPAVNIFILKNIIYTLISIMGFTLLFFKIFCNLLPYLNKINILEKHENLSIKNFIIMVMIILLGYSIYFIRYFPAIMTSDSYYVIHYANNFILSDFHPFGHTWFVGIFLHLGKFIFHNMNKAVAFAAIIQMICMVLIFSYSIKYLYDRGLKKSICILLLFVYALNPLHCHYSITLWRDILFGGAFVLLLISLYEFVAEEENIKIRYIVLFIIGTLIILFFRNNGIYIYLFMIPFVIVILKKRRTMMSILCFSILSFYFIVKGPVFSYFNIEKTTSVEAFSIPLQQIARVIASDRDILGEDRVYLENLFNYKEVKEKYSPVISDPIKNITNNDVLSNNKIDFFKVYIKLFIKYPNVYA